MRHVLSALLLCLLSACATGGLWDGSLAIDTATRGQPLPGANCTVSNGAGSWTVVTPATIVVGAPSGDLRILCNMNGYRTSEVLYRPSGPIGSNIGVGIGGGSGNVGVGLGFGFPLFFGGPQYPSRVAVDMTPQ